MEWGFGGRSRRVSVGENHTDNFYLLISDTKKMEEEGFRTKRESEGEPTLASSSDPGITREQKDSASVSQIS